MVVPKRVEARSVIEKIVPEGATCVNTSAEKSAPVGESGDITLSPFYHSSVNEITQPDKYVAMSRYFVLRWQRDLGPTGTAILLHLRAECFSNRKTGELRDTKQTTVQAIANGIGVSEKTVRREFNANKSLARFVRVQREFAQDTKRGGFRNAPSTYQVAMDDPLHSIDEAKLTAIVRRKAQEADKSERGPETALDRAKRQVAQSGAEEPKKGEAPPQPAPGQNAASVRDVPSGQNVQPTFGQIGLTHPDTTSGQNDRTQNEAAHRSVILAQDVDKLSLPLVNLSPPPVNLTAPSGQIDRTLDHDSETTLEITSTTTTTPESDTQAGAEEEEVVVGGNSKNDAEQESMADEPQDMADEPQADQFPQAAARGAAAESSPARLADTLANVIADAQRPDPAPLNRLAAAMQDAADKLGEPRESIENACDDLVQEGYTPDEVAQVFSAAVTTAAEDKRDKRIKNNRADGQPDVVRYLRGVLLKKMEAVRSAPPVAKTYIADPQKLKALVLSHPADGPEAAAEFDALPPGQQGTWLDKATKHWATLNCKSPRMVRITAIKSWWASAYPDAAEAYQAAQDAENADAAARHKIRQRGLGGAK